MMRTHLILNLILCALFPVSSTSAQTPPGVFLDDEKAEKVGEWQESTNTRPFHGKGYIHDQNKDKGAKSVRFTFNAPEAGKYHFLMSFTASGNRANNVPVSITTADGDKQFFVDETKTPEWPTSFHPISVVEFNEDQNITITISNENTKGHVIVDAVWLLKPEDFEAQKKAAVKIANKEKGPEPAPVEMPKFVREAPAQEVARLTSEQLDAMLSTALGEGFQPKTIDDEQFLRRVTLDLVGRLPSLEEQEIFAADPSPDKRRHAIDRLLQHPDYGRNWGNFWSEIIGSRQMEPELTFHDYTPFKKWLAEQFNQGKGWDQMTFEMFTPVGKVGEQPQGTFLAFHQGNAHRIAGETTRVFLGVKIACAECHDHPFIDMPQQTFHGIAAFFARTSVKIAQNESDLIEISSKDKGEHRMPGANGDIMPTLLDGSSQQPGMADMDRREILARWMVSPDNSYFARNYVNHVWNRVMGRGFYYPVDDMGEGNYPFYPEIHDALSAHLIAANFDHRELFRVVLNSKFYQQPLTNEKTTVYASAIVKKLRGDEVFDSLVTAIELPNYTPPPMKKTAAVRFPPPPKSTRDLVNEAFNYDPSFADELIPRTMAQAMLLMNNAQVQKQVDATPGSGTVLARLLEEEPDNQKVIKALYQRVLAREPKASELEILEAHLAATNDRKAAFEDILWSLLNSAEFTTRN